MANEKILVVDDDKNICELLRLYLVKEGYSVTMAHDGESALTDFDKLHPDLVLLDVMMPVMDGWEVCRKIRAKDNTPIIMLTAKGETYDKVLGLELGADDYIVKPFDAKEVTARIKAVLRRTAAKEETNKGVYDFDNLHLDMNRYELKVKGKVVEAPPKELELLACLAGHPNRVYTRDQLLDEVWGFEYYGDSRTIDVHVKRLREKLEGASEQWNLYGASAISSRSRNEPPQHHQPGVLLDHCRSAGAGPERHVRHPDSTLRRLLRAGAPHRPERYIERCIETLRDIR